MERLSVFYHIYLVKSCIIHLLRSEKRLWYRDTVQDIQGIIHINPELAAEKIRFMISAQVDNGGGLPLVKFDHKAGHETCPDENDENSIYAKETGHPCYRADDALWLFPTVNKYIGESGNKAFLDEVIVYAKRWRRYSLRAS